MDPKSPKIAYQLKGNWMPERRRVERKEFTKPLDFEASTFGSAMALGRGSSLDISSRGLGLLTEYRLERGMVLRLILPEYWGGTTIPVFAEVTWTRAVTGRMRAGLRFM